MIIVLIIGLGIGSYYLGIKNIFDNKESNKNEQTDYLNDEKIDNDFNIEQKEENKVEEDHKEITFDKTIINKWLENFAIELMYGFNVREENEFNIDFT